MYGRDSLGSPGKIVGLELFALSCRNDMSLQRIPFFEIVPFPPVV
jgi:hypothetical protein